MSVTATTDPVRLAVLTNRMQAIVRQMLNTVYRTGRSGVINTARDVIACIVTREDEMLAMGDSLPIMTMAGPDLVTGWARRYHPSVRAGDAFLHNSPYEGNSHTGDHALLVPVVDADGELHCWVYVKAHLADVGNSLPTTAMPGARDVYEEGALVFSCAKVQSDYRDVEDVMRMCTARIRVPEMWRGDYLAMLGAVRTAERELLALGEEIGWGGLHDYMRDWLDHSERRMASAVEALPSGARTGVTRFDAQALPGVEEGLEIRARVEVRGEEGMIEVDCRDNPACVPCGINLTEATSQAAVRLAVFNSLGGEVPVNGGSFRRIRILLRENCVAGIPVHPYSCSMATTGIANRLSGAVQLAFSQLGEGLGMAEPGAAYAAADSIISGRDPRHGGAPFVNLPVLGATGGPAGPHADGWLLLVAGAGGMMLRDSTEMDELLHPIRIEQDRIVTDSEGAGRLRGSPANLVEYGPVGATIELVCSAEANESAPLGARGGGSAPVSHQYKRAADGTLAPVPSPSVVTLGPGEAIVSYSSGGGGYGPPHEREIERVLRDIAEGYVSRGRAAEVYGVAVDADGKLDAAATAALRSAATGA
ncbi:MAG: hydantoinase B/oxoprolinase family protein [Actinobacteria bacterium]|nr:hydantoinase B/oxoprolinase family protein [Actinomycetota bacterium]